MKKIALLLCLITLVSCASTHRITQVEFDKNKRLYSVKVEGNPQPVYLRDDHFYLIRNEIEKDLFIRNYNNYWALDKKLQTNEYYNQYY
jgi:hypothetical protein